MFFQRKITTHFRSCVSITAEVNQMVEESGVREGLCLVFLPNPTVGLAITSFWDPRGLEDLMDEIDRNIPTLVSFKRQVSPYDASGQIKSALMGNSVSLIIHEGKLILGSSQGLVMVEFDGPQLRDFYVLIFEKEFYLEKHDLKTCYMGMHDLTETLQQIVVRSKTLDGICHVSVLHSTAGLLLGPKDPVAAMDVMEDLERMVPTRVDFKHRETASDAGGHVKTALTSSQMTLTVQKGKLMLGTKQAVFFAEFDGPRPRSIHAAIYADQ